MAHYVTNNGIDRLIVLATGANPDIRAGVIKTTAPSKATIKDCDFVSELLTTGTGASVEATAASYARADLASVAVTKVDGSDTVTITAAAPSFGAAAAGETWVSIFYYIEGASDAARVLLSVDTPTSSIATNGATVTGPALSITFSDPTA